MAPATHDLLPFLARTGLLLVQDKSAMNVATLITGEALRTSWWSHPKGRLIFAALDALEDHPDVLFAKLLDRKVTLIHRQMWPLLLAAVGGRDAWQMDRLSEKGQRLLDEIESARKPMEGDPKIARELDLRLLVHSRQVHSESGKHVTLLESWASWAKRTGTKPLKSREAARKRIAEAAVAIGAPIRALPWY